MVTVEAMPGNIPVALELDVTELLIGDQRHASDVAVPSGVTTHLDPETVVAQVAAPRVSVEEEEAAEAAEGEEGAAEGPAEGPASAEAGESSDGE
jgi:large subunit ribosomal protein L25